MVYRLLNRLALACASAGLTIATVLTISHAANMPLPCGGGNGCDAVAHDPSSYYMGVPVSAIGMAAYVVLVIAGALRIAGIAVRWSSFAGLMVSIFGTGVSALLTVHSITKIHAICLWCLASGAMMVLSAVAYLATPDASKGMKDGGKPVSALPWALVPVLLISAIAVFGRVGRPKPPDLSAIDLNRVSFDVLAGSSRALGKPTARVTIVEFADLMCPACREMHQRLLLFMFHNHGRARLMYHHFPLVREAGHEQAEYAAELSAQLDDDDFWGFVSKVYSLDERPDRLGLDKIFAAFHGKRLRTQQGAKEEVQREMKIGQDLGVNQTPTYILFIDGKPDAKASSYDIKDVIKRPEFAKIFSAPVAKGK
jgi:protein-disulfide isomerase